MNNTYEYLNELVLKSKNINSLIKKLNSKEVDNLIQKNIKIDIKLDNKLKIKDEIHNYLENVY